MLTYRQAVEFVVAVEEDAATSPAGRCRARSLYGRLRILDADAPPGDDYRALLEVDAWVGEILVDKLEHAQRELGRVFRGEVPARPDRRLEAAELLGRLNRDFPELPESDRVDALWESFRFLERGDAS